MKSYYMVGGSVRQEADGLLINGLGYRAQEILTLAAENQALRERAEAAETMAESLRKMEEEAADGEREYRRIAEKAADVMLRAVAERDEARRAEDAAWNDAIEAAAKEYFSWAEVEEDMVERKIRALRRAAPTEGEA